MKKGMRTISIVCFILGVVFIPGALNYCLRYEPDVYDCTEMSRDLEDRFESIGFDVLIKRGYEHEGDAISHLWVCVNGLDIDSVLFLPFYPSIRFNCNQCVFDDFEEMI